MVVDEYVQARPCAALRPFVAFYSGYRQHGMAPGRHRGLPSPYLTLIFTLDEPLVVAAHPDPRQAAGTFDALIGGLHVAPALITHPGRQSGVQVAVRPLGCRALFGLPAAEIAHRDIEVGALLGDRVVESVRERMRAEPSWAGRFAALDAILLRGLRAGGNVRPEVAYAVKRLFRGDVPISSVAGEVGWSGRYLTDRFRAELGLRPKEAARVARFDRARRAIRPSSKLADIAAGHGFADQSHLVREFRAFAGCAPSEWLADEFGFVQALAGLPGEDEVHD
ncbi:helix-turn-helix transcriptional regulator [Actinoplanes sp. TBRC 11911]|uniref:helix-turn-helix transcriptional regulator n=1 Tax=Actinoplanes sp. TBRC 11911 TaxID=2729386 RepID=UPI00145D3521|nr:helix-turn-helix transcriptional regulator [Actinoplanes sp. TBRC 11911]NMO51378.1 helix-turn-helix transcriptional regulator [Actinoplanes sp. TBRC 11911]